jgi:cell division protein FtsI/penicillin-binding protein 2
VFTGTVPLPRNDAEKAATMIGQGGVRVSPLGMALVAGAVETGTWRPPYLLRDPQEGQTAAPESLPPVSTSDLKKLVRRSVYQGTAKDANVGSGANKVSGVAATVTYNEDGRAKTVSWFVGSRGDAAFAIAVEGKYNAAQLAASFLTGTPISSSRAPAR